MVLPGKIPISVHILEWLTRNEGLSSASLYVIHIYIYTPGTCYTHTLLDSSPQPQNSIHPEGDLLWAVVVDNTSRGVMLNVSILTLQEPMIFASATEFDPQGGMVVVRNKS